jgi:hypothetical protein
MSRLLILTLASIALTGCAVKQPLLYSWGNYDQMLYESYKDPTRANALRVELETRISGSEQQRQKIPPGLYAELGTIYLQGGDSNKAIDLYKKESAAWPESRGIMNAMIRSLEGRQKPAEGESAK